ncbi:MAG: hypothetical protein AAFY19_05045 [Pseudomonadota bacterium]
MKYVVRSIAAAAASSVAAFAVRALVRKMQNRKEATDDGPQSATAKV